MIGWKLKLWRGVGAAALVSLAAACGQPGEDTADGATGVDAAVSKGEAGAAGEAGEAAIGESGAEHGEAGVATAYAGLSGDARTALRLQHLKGFVLIAAQSAEGDRPADAAVLIQQGLLEVYDPAADQFGRLDVAPVRAAADAGEQSRAAFAQATEAASAALNQTRAGLTFNHADIAARMVDLSTGLYQHVIGADFVDPIEYQHSLGAALSARDVLVAGEEALRARDSAAYEEALAEINRFIALWPEHSAPETPTPYRNVLAQASRVRLALSPLLS